MTMTVMLSATLVIIGHLCELAADEFGALFTGQGSLIASLEITLLSPSVQSSRRSPGLTVMRVLIDAECFALAKATGEGVRVIWRHGGAY
jgi:hypothetical protein